MSTHLDLSHTCDSGFFSRVVCPEPCGSMHSFCDSCGARQDFCPHDDPSRDQVPGALNVGAVLHDVLSDLIADHPMWTGPDGQPLDYSAEREAKIAAFVDAVTDTTVARLRAAVGTPEKTA